MHVDDVLELIENQSGDEHLWIDFKEDYEIGGIAKKKAEFIKDISSLANTISEREIHYIVVGVNDKGSLVGITEGRESYRGEGPRHIFSYDESDIQEIIDSNLTPAPKIAWHTYEHDSKLFGILEIDALGSPPCFTTRHIDEDDHRHLHKGIIYVRKGSGKKIAGREEVENILEYRIEKQREQILEGVHKAIEIGPEWIDRLANALPKDAGIPLSTAESPESADIQITERLTREPASSLDQQLNQDISEWQHRGDDFVEAKPLWQYYANPNSLNLDKTALLFLTQSAIKNYVFGGFWLAEADPEDRVDILLNTPVDHLRAERSGSLMLILNDEEGFNELMEACNTSADYGHLKTCKRKLGNEINDRVNYLLKNNRYSLSHNGWRKEIDVKDYDQDDIEELIPIIGGHLVDLQEIVDEEPRFGQQLQDFREALSDLEVIYAACVLEDYN